VEAKPQGGPLHLRRWPKWIDAYMASRNGKKVELTAFQQNLLLSACPSGATVVSAAYFRLEYLPAPVRVVVSLPNGGAQTLVLRLANHGPVEEEARLLPYLEQMGVPVPSVLAGPARDPDSPDAPAVAVYSFLPGRNLQELAESSVEGCRLAMALVVDGAAAMASLTPRLQQKPQLDFLRTITLSDKLAGLVQTGDPWLREAVFIHAVATLRPVLHEVADSPVFTGGDYQPANFLTDGKRLSGFVDFETACYQDFLFGFAKYPIYDLHPMNKAGFVPFLLERRGVSRRDFDIRVALGCLATLQREIPVSGGDTTYRAHVLTLLEQALTTIQSGKG